MANNNETNKQSKPAGELLTEKFTTELRISGVPISLKKKIDDIADRKGVTTAAFMKMLIQDYFEKTTHWEAEK